MKAGAPSGLRSLVQPDDALAMVVPRADDAAGLVSDRVTAACQRRHGNCDDSPVG
jgi:hypothetical protein